MTDSITWDLPHHFSWLNQRKLGLGAEVLVGFWRWYNIQQACWVSLNSLKLCINKPFRWIKISNILHNCRHKYSSDLHCDDWRLGSKCISNFVKPLQMLLQISNQCWYSSVTSKTNKGQVKCKRHLRYCKWQHIIQLILQTIKEKNVRYCD